MPILSNSMFAEERVFYSLMLSAILLLEVAAIAIITFTPQFASATHWVLKTGPEGRGKFVSYADNVEVKGTVYVNINGDIFLIPDKNYRNLLIKGNLFGPSGPIPDSPIIKLERYGYCERIGSEECYPGEEHSPILKDENGTPIRILDEHGNAGEVQRGDRIRITGVYAIDYSHSWYVDLCDEPSARWQGDIWTSARICFAHAEIHPYDALSIVALKPLEPGKPNVESHIVVAPVYDEYYSYTWFGNYLHGLTCFSKHFTIPTILGLPVPSPCDYTRLVDDSIDADITSEFFIEAPPKPAECATGASCQMTFQESNVIRIGNAQMVEKIEHPNGVSIKVRAIASTATTGGPSACLPIVQDIESLKARVERLQERLRSAPTNQKADLVDLIIELNSQIEQKENELRQCIEENAAGPTTTTTIMHDDPYNPSIYQATWSVGWSVAPSVGSTTNATSTNTTSSVPTNVTEEQQPPQALDRQVETTMNTPVGITLRGSDANPNDELTAEIVSPPSNGQLSVSEINQDTRTVSEINQDTRTVSTVTYTPNPGFIGQDSFTYKVNDGIADSINIATVSITVNDNGQEEPPLPQPQQQPQFEEETSPEGTQPPSDDDDDGGGGSGDSSSSDGDGSGTGDVGTNTTTTTTTIDPNAVVDQDQDLDGFTLATGDCDDTNPSAFPAAMEVAANGIDDDCDGIVDEEP